MTKGQYCVYRKLSLLFLFVLTCLPVAGLAQSKGIIKRVTFKDAHLSSVLTTLAKQLEIEVVIEDSVREAKMSIDLQDVTPDTAIKAILAQKHLQGRLLDDKRAVIFSDDEVNRLRFIQYKVWPDEAPTSGDQGKQIEDTEQNATVKDVSVKTVLATLGRQLSINFVFDDMVKENKVNLELKDVTLKAVMKVALIQQHLQARLIEDKTIIVFPDNEGNRQRYAQYKVWPDDTEKK